ncbi:MAG: hypothetical protein KDI07_07830 [Anaerolineae bacterium]|nr:hypothetical protein [Anaerolineae bacterium]
MNVRTGIVLLLLTGIVLAGCAGPAGPAQPTSTVDQPTMTPAPLATPTDATVPTEPPPAASEPPTGVPATMTTEQVVKVLSGKLAVDPTQMTLVSMEPVNWPDSCLGVNTMEIMCAEVITPGYRIVVEVDGLQTTVHTNEDLSVALIADVEQPAGAVAEDVIVSWQAPGEPCIAGQISAEWINFGPCGSPPTQTAPLPQPRAAELAYYTMLYASYDAETPSGMVSLKGDGPARAEAADQRSLAAWAGEVVADAAGGQADPLNGLAMIWRREGGIAGFCDGLSVYAGGHAPAVTCQTSPASDLGARWLSSPQLGQVFGWIDALASFQYSQKDPATADAMTLDLSFNGTGQSTALQVEQQAMLDYAGQLFTFGALATPTRFVQADADTPMVTGPGPQFEQIGEVFGGQMAFVTGVSQDGRWWRVICADDTVGDCWLAGDQVTPQVATPSSATPASYDPGDIYQRVVRQVYTVDHTYGQPPNFPVVYLVRRTDDSVGASGSPANGQAIAPADQERISAALSDLPARFIWVDKADDVPRDPNGAVADGGAIITVGNITAQPDGTLHVPASIYIAMLAAGGQTYVLENFPEGWQITGTSGPAWIS